MMSRRPTDDDRKALLRLLHGELPAAEAEALRARLAAEPELSAAHARLAAAWEAAEPPPAAPPPPGFTGRVTARVRAEGREPAGTQVPRWARAAAAAAAALAGLVLGLRLPALVLPATGGGAVAAGSERAPGGADREEAGDSYPYPLLELIRGVPGDETAASGEAGIDAMVLAGLDAAPVGEDGYGGLETAGGLAGGYWAALDLLEPAGAAAAPAAGDAR